MTDVRSVRPAESARIDELENADRLEEAATAATTAGDHARASELWERAVRFGRAARSALAAGDAIRALLLAARSEDPSIEPKIIEALVQGDDSLAAAEAASGAGHFATAARLRLAIGDWAGAGSDFERGGRLLDAASAFARARKPKSAARCLEAAIEREPDLHVARLRLGALLLEHGRTRPGIRALQALPEDCEEHGAALRLLFDAFQTLGLDDAADDVKAQMKKRGVSQAASRPPPRSSSRTAVAQRLFGRYDVLAAVATTPTARVVKARDTITGDEVAVKIFSAASLRDAGRDALERFRREARILGDLRHPAIVPLHDYLPSGPAVVLAWMSGGSMADLLAAEPIAPARAAEIAASVLSALGEAHRRGILHRDIKPANVLFDGAGGPHLADFGTAHVSDAAATVTAGVLGTLAYMAPEQRAGAPATTESDVYGVGALFWHALTGGPPGSDLPFLSDELTDAHQDIARALIGAEADRPNEASSAAELLASQEWPRAVPRARAVTRKPSNRPPARSVRLEPRRGVLHHDTLLGRDVFVLRSQPETMERVLPYARTDHPALPCVLRLDRDREIVWIDAVVGRPLSRSLTPEEHSRLAAALGALHRAGGYHGSVDAEHVVERGDELMLRFPLDPKSRSTDDDLAGLRRLEGDT